MLALLLITIGGYGEGKPNIVCFQVQVRTIFALIALSHWLASPVFMAIYCFTSLTRTHAYTHTRFVTVLRAEASVTSYIHLIYCLLCLSSLLMCC